MGKLRYLKGPHLLGAKTVPEQRDADEPRQEPLTFHDNGGAVPVPCAAQIVASGPVK
jgi:hypothetical protein